MALPFRINRNDPEAVGLASCLVTASGGVYDVLRGIYLSRTGTSDPFRTSARDTLANYYAGGSDMYSDSVSNVDTQTYPVTMVWEGYLDSIAAGFAWIGAFQSVDGVNGPVRAFYSNNASYQDVSFGLVASQLCRGTLPSGISLTGQRHWGVWTWNGGTITTASNHQCWINGQPLSMTTSSSAGGITNQNSVGGTSSGTNGTVGDFSQLRYYIGRGWTQSDASRFFNPATRGSLFRLPERKIFFDTSGSPFDGFYDAPIFRVKSQAWRN